MNREDYQVAAGYWEKKDASSVKMPEDELREHFKDFLEKHNTVALATASADGVRCTPLEYSVKSGRIVIFSEGGEKFRNLESNKKVSCAVFDPYGGFGTLSSVQISGTADVDAITGDNAGDYEEYLSFPADMLKKVDHPMYLIRITPEKADVLCSAFKDKGYDVRQHLEF